MKITRKSQLVRSDTAVNVAPFQSMTQAEQKVVDFFDTRLHASWEIYVRPYLNGLKPSIVLFNPVIGIAVYEIRDWNLAPGGIQIDTRNRVAPQLFDAASASVGSRTALPDPFARVLLCRDEIYSLYCPTLEAFSAVTVGVLFPNAPEQRVRDVMAPFFMCHGAFTKFAKHNLAVGAEKLAKGQIYEVLPNYRAVLTQKLHSRESAALRDWITGSPTVSTGQESLEMDARQRELVLTRTQSGYRRLKGPAGSGKSLVLAARAAYLASQGKQILVITYNITILNYLRRLYHQSGYLKDTLGSGQTTWMHFHGWCKRICEISGHYQEYLHLFRSCNLQKVLETEMPALVDRILTQNDSTELYDAILVDEGQDFYIYWWNVLRKACRHDGEMLLVADQTQNIYGTARVWTDAAMHGCGFSGDWVRLKTSYRLPRAVIDLARNYATSFLAKDTLDLPESPRVEQLSLDLDPVQLRWVQCKPEFMVEVCVQEIVAMQSAAEDQTSDGHQCTFITESIASGQDIVKRLNSMKVKVFDTYASDWRVQQRKKMAFATTSLAIAATTLHSFKGWEARNIVIHINKWSTEADKAVIYTALTRIKRHSGGSSLTVVSSVQELTQFGRTWPTYIEHVPSENVDHNRASTFIDGDQTTQDTSATGSDLAFWANDDRDLAVEQAHSRRGSEQDDPQNFDAGYAILEDALIQTWESWEDDFPESEPNPDWSDAYDDYDSEAWEYFSG